MPPGHSHGERSLCPLVVRITPMPHFAADWQVAQHLRPFGDVTSVRFQRTGDGTAFVRFQTSNGAEMALRAPPHRAQAGSSTRQPAQKSGPGRDGAAFLARIIQATAGTRWRHSAHSISCSALKTRFSMMP